LQGIEYAVWFFVGV